MYSILASCQVHTKLDSVTDSLYRVLSIAYSAITNHITCFLAFVLNALISCSHMNIRGRDNTNTSQSFTKIIRSTYRVRTIVRCVIIDFTASKITETYG